MSLVPALSNVENVELEQRIFNSLRLGALGDRLGSWMEGVELQHRSVCWSKGTITDDTILTLATTSAIAQLGRVDPATIAAQMTARFQLGIVGLGSTTFAALTALREGQHWALAGLTGERSAGNGAAMRIAPAAYLLDPGESQDRNTLRDVARITHRNDEAVTAALAFSSAIRLALSGETVRSIAIRTIVDLLPDTRVRDGLVRLQADELSPSAAIEVIGSSGYAPESVPLAIYLGFEQWNTARAGLELAAMEAQDSDTVASMVGQLLGAAGHSMPGEQLDPSTERLIRSGAKALAAACSPKRSED